jgi:hypothetical protein
MSFPVPLQPPPDGFDTFEKLLLREVVITLYKKMKSPEDKFIFIATHEMGYSIDMVAKMLCKNQVRISIKLKKIIGYLRTDEALKKMSENI